MVGTAIGYSSTWNNIASVVASSANQETIPGTNTTNSNFSVVGDDPTVNKQSLTKTTTPGGVAQYRITISNPSNGAILNNVSISDILPTGFTYLAPVSLTMNSGATQSGSVAPILGATSLLWRDFTLLPGGIVNIVFDTRVSASLPYGPTIYHNSATIDYVSQITGTGTRSYDGTLPGRTFDDITLPITAISAMSDTISAV